MALVKKLETVGAVASVCGAALAISKVYQLLHNRQVQKLQESHNRRTYDLVLHIHGSPVHSDWGLTMNKDQDLKEEVAVAVFGDFNVGKTHLINRISGLNLPFGETDHTTGVSIKSSPQGILWIDTAGMGAPYCVRTQTVEEKYGTEQLIAELAYCLSDAQIVVVSHCSLRDQEFITALHKWQMDENRPGKNLLIVVHNYCRISNPDLLEIAFLNDVVSRFWYPEEVTLPDRTNPARRRKVWVDKSDNYPIYHVLLGQEGSPAGDRYNGDTYSSIFTLCTSRLGFSQRQSYLRTLIHVLNYALLQKYFGIHLRLRVNDVGNKLVPEQTLHSANSFDKSFGSIENGGSLPGKTLPTSAPEADPSSGQHIHKMYNPSQPGGFAGGPSAQDSQTAVHNVLRKIDGLENDPITKLTFSW